MEHYGIKDDKISYIWGKKAFGEKDEVRRVSR